MVKTSTSLLPDIIAKNVSHLLAETKYSQRLLSTESGIAQSTISDVCSGKGCNVATIDDIATFFKIPTYLFLARDFSARIANDESCKKYRHMFTVT